MTEMAVEAVDAGRLVVVTRSTAVT